MYKIEDNIPLIKRNNSKYSEVKNALQKLSVNQSFFIPIEIDDAKKKRNIAASIRSISTIYGKENNVTYATRLVVEKEVYGLRIWRIQ